MKIADIVCAVGRSGYFNKDLAAIRQGVRQDGFAYLDPPVTAGFNAVIQPGEALSVMLVLDDGQVAHGDCMDVIFTAAAGRDPLFLAETQRRVAEGPIAELLRGRDAGEFRALAGEIEDFRADGRALHTALRYGFSQALLHASALAARKTAAEVIARDWNTRIAENPLPILGMCPTDHRMMVEKMILKRVDILPHGSFANLENDLGPDGAKLIAYAEWVSGRVRALGASDYHPSMHLDVYGTLGQLFGEDWDAMAEFVGHLADASAPMPLYLETPMIAASRDGQIEAFQALTRICRARGIDVKLIADEWCNTLDDIQAFAEAGAADFLQVKMPDLGGIQNSIDALLLCRANGAGVYLGGSANETDQSARLSAHVGLACRADFIMNKPGQGVDEGVSILTNEMARTLALIAARKARA